MCVFTHANSFGVNQDPALQGYIQSNTGSVFSLCRLYIIVFVLYKLTIQLLH